MDLFEKITYTHPSLLHRSNHVVVSTVEKLENESSHWKDKYQSTISNQQDKVDKSLIKNLLIGLIQAFDQKKDNQLQVLRLLSTVLDFDQKECEKVGLSSKPPDRSGDSLAQEFIKFLEKESRPALNTVLPNLLNLGQSNDALDGKPPVRKISRIRKFRLNHISLVLCFFFHKTNCSFSVFSV